MNIWYGTKLLSALFCNSFHWWKTGLVGLWCLTPLSTIFQLYRGGKMEGWKYFNFSFLFYTDNRIWVFDCVLIHIDYIYTEYYMSKSVSHAVSTPEPYITPRATRGNIGFSGWYGMWYRFWHVIFSMHLYNYRTVLVNVLRTQGGLDHYTTSELTIDVWCGQQCHSRWHLIIIIIISIRI